MVPKHESEIAVDRVVAVEIILVAMFLAMMILAGLEGGTG